jgi:hypothetical protein
LIQPFQDQNHDTEFLVVSNACAQGSTAIQIVGSNGLPTSQIPTYCSPESPSMIRKLMDNDVRTEVAWRGNPATLSPCHLMGWNAPEIVAAALQNYDSAGGAVLGIAGSNRVYNLTFPAK